MGIVAFQAILAFGTITSVFIAIFGFFNKPNQFLVAKDNAVSKYGKSLRAVFDAFFCVYLKQLIFSFVAILLGIAFALIAIFVPPPGIPSTPTPTPTAPPFETFPAPIKATLNDVWLDELDPIEPREKAFVWYIWNAFDPIQVKNETYKHSIGVRIPDDVMKSYDDSNSEGLEHKEYIEYQLSYNYDTFQFDYGIDDLSFPSEIEQACKCEYKIVVQSCNAQDYLGENDNILFDSGWLNYRSILNRSTPMDVSACESIRITVYWQFNMRQNGPSAFNIAIVNPILRVEKTDTMASQPPAEYAKPDSNH